MKINTKDATTLLSSWMRLLGAMLMAALMIPSVAVAQSYPAPVNLGTAGDFVILSKTGISSTGTTAIVGDIGVSPVAATYITGFGLIMDPSGTFSTSALVTGKVYAADYTEPTPTELTTAVSDMETAYTDAAGRTLPDYTELYAGDLTGQTLTHGLYKWGTGVLISTGGVTISGNASDVWIFQIAGALTVGNGAIVTLSGGAQAKNIFWQVADQTTLGTTSDFKGIILCQTLIEMQTGATLIGRALAQTAVTLDANWVVLKSKIIPSLTLNPSSGNGIFNINWSVTNKKTTSITYSVWIDETNTNGHTKTIVNRIITLQPGQTYSKIKARDISNKQSGVYTYTLNVGTYPSTVLAKNVKTYTKTFVDLNKGISTEAIEILIPESSVLESNYPNPFNPSTTIRFGLSQDDYVLLKIYNALGQEVFTLVNELQSAGFHDVIWNGIDNSGNQVTSGIYFYRLSAGNFVVTKKMLMIR